MDKKTVLFVDDEEKILKSLKRDLMDEPYETLFANSGKEALEILQHKQVHVLVTDMRMPKMSGPELLKIVKENYPHIVRIMVSGYVHVNSLLDSVNNIEVFKFLTKPCELEETLKPAVLEALDYYDVNFIKSDAPVGKLE